MLNTSEFHAGDYDALIPGMYGEPNISSDESSREIIPLLRKLIKVIEQSGPLPEWITGMQMERSQVTTDMIQREIQDKSVENHYLRPHIIGQQRTQGIVYQVPGNINIYISVSNIFNQASWVDGI